MAVDQGSIEPLDFGKNPAPTPFAYRHMNLVTRRGIFLFENIDMEGLSKEKPTSSCSPKAQAGRRDGVAGQSHRRLVISQGLIRFV
ncbi:MAG: hypothetical protein U1F68_18945 [Gammaproteobacteria bacterium]